MLLADKEVVMPMLMKKQTWPDVCCSSSSGVASGRQVIDDRLWGNSGKGEEA